MKKLFEFLWSGCFHEWDTIKEQDMVENLTYQSGKSTRSEYTKYTLRCKKCGNIKYITV